MKCCGSSRCSRTSKATQASNGYLLGIVGRYIGPGWNSSARANANSDVSTAVTLFPAAASISEP